MPKHGKPIILNGNIHVLSTVIKLVASSAAEAELAALFLNAQQARIIRLILHEMGHTQPPTPIHIDNSTCVGLVNNTRKRSKSRAMNEKYFWLLGCDAQKEFSFHQHPGQENLGVLHPKHTQELYTNMYAPTTCTWKIHQKCLLEQ